MTTLTITRIVPAAPESVWTAWTDAHRLCEWFWPERFEAEADVDLRPGGTWRIGSELLGMAATGEFIAVEPVERLQYTWRWEKENGETEVTVNFVPVKSTRSRVADGGPRTRVVVIHAGFPTLDVAAEHERGWNDCLDRLPEAVSR